MVVPYEKQINISDFEIREELGRGGFATVYKAKCLRKDLKQELGDYVAIKKINKRDKNWTRNERFVKRELKIHSSLEHPNIVKFYEILEDQDYIYMVLELCSNGSLEDYMKREAASFCFSEREAYKIIKQVVDGVIYLHNKFIIHRDLSLKNILLTKNKEVRIADFGLATELSHPTDTKCTMAGTPLYMAPEVMQERSHGLKRDCWSLGCILYALLVGNLPFNSKRVCDVQEEVLKNEVWYPSHITSEAKELLEALLTKIESRRIDVYDIHDFMFFKKYEQNSFNSKTASSRSTDSGIGSVGSNSSSAIGKGSYGYQRHLDSGFDSINSKSKGFNMSPSRASKEPCLETIQSSGGSCHGSDSRSRLKAGSNFKQENRNSAGNFSKPSTPPIKELPGKSGNLGQLKNKICPLPPRLNPFQNNPGCIGSCEPCVSEESKRIHNYHLSASSGPLSHKVSPKCLSYGYSYNRISSEERRWQDDQNVHHRSEEVPANVMKYFRQQKVGNSHERSVSEERRQQYKQNGNCHSEEASRNLFQAEACNGHERSVSEERRQQDNKKICHRSRELKDLECSSHQKIRTQDSGNRSHGKSSQFYSSQKENDHEDPLCSISCCNYHPEIIQKCEDRNCRFNHPLRDDDCNVAPPSPSCSHNCFCYIESVKCSHVNSCSCQRNTCHSYHKENSAVVNVCHSGKNIISKKCSRNNMIQKPAPLNAIRLKPMRHRIRNTIVSISEDMKVIIELLETKNKQENVSEVGIISTDGMQIEVYKPRNALLGDIPPSAKNSKKNAVYSYEKFPKSYWKMYLKAKRVVDSLRAKTSKITFCGKNGRCIMMENFPDPNFEMIFYDGARLTRKSNKVTIIDKHGRETVVDDKVLDKSCKSMLEDFQIMKTICEKIEHSIESMGSLKDCLYPLVIQSHAAKTSRNSNNENHPPKFSPESLVGNEVKLYNRPSSKMCFTQNTSTEENIRNNFSAHQSSLSSQHETVLPKMEDILKQLRSNPQVVHGSLFFEYKDGYQFWISADAKRVDIYDTAAGKWLEEHPAQVEKRIQQDLPIIMYFIQNKEGSIT